MVLAARSNWAAGFPLASDLVMFNHASFGQPTRDLLNRAEQIRLELDADPSLLLGGALGERLDHVVAEVGRSLGLEPECTALTTNATAGAAAIQCSLPIVSGDVVVVLDCEYSSVLRGWQRRCGEVGADLRVIPVPLPFVDVDELIARMSTIAGNRVAILQFSAISSSAALRLPIRRLAEWGHERGATVVVDAAHAPGQIDLSRPSVHQGAPNSSGHRNDGSRLTGGEETGGDEWVGVDAAFGTLHKWFPVPRSVGILWTTPALSGVIRPAETSLTSDDPRLSRRFAWPGTFDPAVRLCLPDAFAVQAQWSRTGELDRCGRLAQQIGQTLAEAGAVPTAVDDLLPPRMRSFLLNDVPLAVLREELLAAGVRAWSGSHGKHASLLRVATHVYNDENDIAAVEGLVRELRSR